MHTYNHYNSDLPDKCRVDHQGPRMFDYTCVACGLTKTFKTRASAFEAAWTHVVEYPCDGLYVLLDDGGGYEDDNPE